MTYDATLDLAVPEDPSGGATGRVGLTDAENHLILVQGVFSAALAIASVFLSLYLFSIGGFRTIAWFYVAQYACMPPAFMVAGYLLRRHTTKDVIRWGLLVLCGVYVALLLLGADAREWAVLLGAATGIGEGIYWPGINLSEYLATNATTRNLYYGKLFAVSNIASVVGLPLSGATLAIASHFDTRQTGYYVLFGLLVLMLLVTHRLGAGITGYSGLTFSTGDLVRHRRTREWWLVLLQNLLRGLWAYALPAFSAVLLYLIVDGELSLGLLSAGTTVLVGASSFFAGRVLQRHPRSFLLGAVVVPFGMVGFAYQQNWLGILCYSVLIMSFDPYAQNATYKAMYDVMEQCSTRWQSAFHFIVEREIAWNAGRVVSFTVILLILDPHDQARAGRTLQHLIVFAAALPVVVGFVQHRLHTSSRESAHPLVPGASQEG
jgi:YQGE family putative transporter